MDHVKSLIKCTKDFPIEGIIYRDVLPVLRDPKAVTVVIDEFAKLTKETGKIDIIAGVEARGFLFGILLAQKLQLPFVPIRKPGKLPGSTYRVDLTKEYGKDSLEIYTDVIPQGANVLIVDDVFATGGTVKACNTLLTEYCKANVLGVLVLALLKELPVDPQYPVKVFSLLTI